MFARPLKYRLLCNGKHGSIQYLFRVEGGNPRLDDGDGDNNKHNNNSNNNSYFVIIIIIYYHYYYYCHHHYYDEKAEKNIWEIAIGKMSCLRAS